MSAPPWMPLYIKDYLADTRRLRAAEHGAYLLLIMEYWQTGGCLPDDDRQLARIACMSDREWKTARPIIEPLFQSGWKHKRVDEELGRANAKHEKRAEAGKRGGNAKAMVGRKSGNALASSSQPQAETRAAQQSASEIERQDRVEVELRSAAGEKAPESADLTPIFGLLEAGYDLVRDIVPVVRERASKATTAISSWRYFVPAIEAARSANAAIKPKTNGPLAEPVAWLPSNSPLWGALNERSQREKKRPLLARGSVSADGVGAYVPKAWLEQPAA